MTDTQAANLQLKWKLRIPAMSCAHLNKVLGHSETGELTGTSHCLICGEEFGGPLLSAKP